MIAKYKGAGITLGMGFVVAVGFLASSGQFVSPTGFPGGVTMDVNGNVSVPGTLGVAGLTTATGGLTVPGALKLTGVQTDSVVSAAKNDFPLTGNQVNVLRYTGAGASTYTGFKCGAADCTSANDGMILIIEVASGANNAVSVVNDSGSSVPGNRVYTLIGNNLLLSPNNAGASSNASGVLIYDGSAASNVGRWRALLQGTSTLTGLTLTNTTLSGTVVSSNTSGASISTAAASATVPTLIPNRADTTTGVGASANGSFNVVASSLTVQRFVSTGPSASNGTVGTNSRDGHGTVTGIGANTSTTLTFGTTTFARCDCLAQPTAHGVVGEYMEVTQSATAPVIFCFASTTSIAANCDDLVYHCDCQ